MYMKGYTLYDDRIFSVRFTPSHPDPVPKMLITGDQQQLSFRLVDYLQVFGGGEDSNGSMYLLYLGN